MARFLLVLFLIFTGFRLLADFSVTAEGSICTQVAQDLNESKNKKENNEKGEQEFEFTFHFIDLLYQHYLLNKALNTGLGHCGPLPGFIISTYTPPETAGV